MTIQQVLRLFALSLIALVGLVGCGTFDLETTAEPIATPTPPPTATSALPEPTAPADPAPASPTVPADAEETPEAESTSPSLFGATFRDTVAGIVIDYPAEWQVVELSDEQKGNSLVYTTTFHSWIAGPGGGEGIPDGETKVDLTVAKDEASTPEAAAITRREQLAYPEGGTTILSEEPVTLAGGLQGTRFRVSSLFGEAEETVTSINGHLVIFSGLGDADLLDQMVQTLRPLDEAGTDEPYTVRATNVQAVRVAEGVERVPVFLGPGPAYGEIATIESGLAVAVSGISEDAGWYQLAGCSEQNPNRPADDCWVSADQTLTEPIRAITPSLQPVVPTEMQSVLVVADGLVPVHSGPAETYPTIGQLAGGFNFAITGASEDDNWWRLAECSSPLNDLLDECWISADPEVTRASEEPIR